MGTRALTSLMLLRHLLNREEKEDEDDKVLYVYAMAHALTCLGRRIACVQVRPVCWVSLP